MAYEEELVAAGISWEGFGDDAGLAGYEVSIGSSPGGDDIIRSTPVGLDTRAIAYARPPNDPTQRVLFSTVTAVSRSGQRVAVTSKGLVMPGAEAPHLRKGRQNLLFNSALGRLTH